MPTARALTFVVNPASGRGRARRVIPRLRAWASARPHLDVLIRVSGDAADARFLADEAIASGRELIVVGGDGMASIGLNAAAGSGVPFGVVPAGTGNDFCRSAGLPTRVGASLAVIAAGATAPVDLTRVTGRLADGAQQRWVGCVVSTGFDARVNHRANHQRINIGAPSYVYAVVAELRRFHPLRYRLVIDGRPREVEALLVAVGNGGVFGGGIRICPGAQMRDGVLDVTIIKPVPPILFFRLFRQLFDGSWAAHPAVERLTGRTVVVDGAGLIGMADGEDLGAVPLRCEVVPGALTLLTPAI